MKRKLFGSIFALFLSLFAFVQSANAVVYSDADMYDKMDKLNTIVNADFLDFVNKSELVGYRLEGFNMAVANYKNNARMSVESLNNSLNLIQEIKQSSEISDTDKSTQIGRIYNDSATLMFGMDNSTMNFLFGLNQIMPTITYKRFIKNYQEFYNELNLTNADLSIKAK